MSETVKSTSWVERVMSRLKGGDEAKLSKFHKEYIKANNKQVGIREDEISDLEEKLEELNDQQAELVETIDFEKVATIASRKHYVDSFRTQQIAQIQEIDAIEEQISEKEEEIVMYEKLNALIK